VGFQIVAESYPGIFPQENIFQLLVQNLPSPKVTNEAKVDAHGPQVLQEALLRHQGTTWQAKKQLKMIGRSAKLIG
jgi:hypothetical protein